MFEFLLGLQAGGLNLPLLVGIIGILQLVKQFDKQHRLKNDFYRVAVLVLGALGGILVSSHSITAYIASTISHAGVASILYQYGKRLLPNTGTKFQLFSKDTDNEEVD